MNPKTFLDSVIAPRAGMLPQHDSPEARLLMLAIAGQESGWDHRLQQPIPYARGFWQCEKNGAVLSVLKGDETQKPIEAILTTLCMPLGLDEVFEAIAWNDTLAYWIARLALAQDPHPLPALGERTLAWETYLRVWRPGQPRPETWFERYEGALLCFDVPNRSPAPVNPLPATS